MEVYYKDFISKDATLDKLVEDLTMVVQGANQLVEAAGGSIKNPELLTKLERLQEGCARIKEQAVAGAAATDKLLRRFPYPSLGVAFGLGILAAAIWCQKRRGAVSCNGNN